MFIWIVLPAYETTIAGLSSDIIKGTCVPWGAYSSYAMEKTVITLAILITYLLPLLWMAFCYSRIVHVLRNKVTSGWVVKARTLTLWRPHGYSYIKHPVPDRHL